MKTYLLFLTFTFILTSCQKDTQENTKPITIVIRDEVPELNFSSPDMTIKSFIKYREWLRKNLANTIEEFGAINNDYLNSFYSEEFPDSLKNPFSFTVGLLKDKIKELYKIEDVDIQTETRAVILVQTSEFTYGHYYDKQPVKERFTLFHNKNHWLIELHELTCMFCDGKGMTGYYKKDICEFCNGSGWAKPTFF